MATDQTSGDEKVVVTFTAEQQAKIDELIRDKQGKAAADVRAELASTKAAQATMETELATLKAALATAKTVTDKKEAKGDIDTLQAQINEMKNASQHTLNELEALRRTAADKDKDIQAAKSETALIRKTIAIQAAAGKVGFVNVEMVSKLTADSVKLDEATGQFVVIENGTERRNSAYNPMTLEEFYAEYAHNNPFLVRGDVRGGSGSKESTNSNLSNNGKFTVDQIFGKKSNGQLANQLIKSNPAEYARMKVIAKDSGLI